MKTVRICGREGEQFYGDDEVRLQRADHLVVRGRPERVEDDAAGAVVLEEDGEVRNDDPALAHRNVVENQVRNVDGRLQAQTGLEENVRSHRVRGLEELVDEADLVGVLDAVPALLPEEVDRAVDHVDRRETLHPVEVALHQQRADDRQACPSLPCRSNTAPSLTCQTVNSHHVQRIQRQPVVDDRVDAPHHGERRRMVVRKTRRNDTTSEDLRIVVTSAQVQHQKVGPVLLCQQTRNLIMTPTSTHTSDILFL